MDHGLDLMKRNEFAVILTTFTIFGFFGISAYLYPVEFSGPPDTWEELFETSEQFRESSYSTFIGVLGSASKPSTVQEDEVIYRQFLTLEITNRINATVFLVDEVGFFIPISSSRRSELIEGFRIGDYVKLKGYPSFDTDIDGQKYKTLQIVSIELVDD